MGKLLNIQGHHKIIVRRTYYTIWCVCVCVEEETGLRRFEYRYDRRHIYISTVCIYLLRSRHENDLSVVLQLYTGTITKFLDAVSIFGNISICKDFSLKYWRGAIGVKCLVNKISNASILTKKSKSKSLGYIFCNFSANSTIFKEFKDVIFSST